MNLEPPTKYLWRIKKYYLSLAGSISIICLTLQSARVLAETSQAASVNSQPVETAKTISTTSASVVEVPQQQTAPIDPINNQVTSVSQLSDVQPSDWAFGALQSLIERYGVIAGYPDGAYKGNRAISRYEFAAGLNAALERINELVASGLGTQLFQQDLSTLQRLQEEFKAELTTLRGRVDNLEARTAELEANQFSTTTKLTGLVAAAVTAGNFSGDRIIDPTGAEIATEQPNATVVYRTSLNFSSSFSGSDLLLVRLEVGSARGNDNAAGFLEPNFGSALDFSLRSAIDEQVQLARLQYTFTPFEDFTLTLGPTISSQDFFDRNSYANQGHRDFASLAFNNNLILLPFLDLGAGGVIEWNPGEGPFTVRAGYLAPRADQPSSTRRSSASPSPLINLLYPQGDSDNGLFGDPNQTIAELEYAPSNALAIRLQYGGGNVFDNRFDVLGINFELALSEKLAIFGRYGYGSYRDTIFGDIKPQSWTAGVAFRDLFVPSALAGIAVAQPFIESKVGNATQTNFEVFYNYPISDNIFIIPSVQVITNPGNQDSNGTIFTGTLRTSLFF
jgi:hypothetical protein